jgi:hypothetical protein
MEKKSLFYRLAWFVANLDKMVAGQYRKKRFDKRLKKAKKEALDRQAQTGRKQYVIVMRGCPRVISKQQIQVLLRRRYFKKGTSIQDIEKMALFVTETFSKPSYKDTEEHHVLFGNKTMTGGFSW